MTNNPNITNVLNPKSLEKQMKIYDTRLQVLQAEVEELSRLKAACQLLLGVQPGVEAQPAASPEAAGAEAKPAKAKGKKEAKADDSAEASEAAAENGELANPAVADFESNQAPSLEN